MSKIICFDSCRKARAAKRGFREWRNLFLSAAELDEHTRWADLPDEIILFFCEEGPHSTHSLYDLLMSAHYGGNGNDFEAQPFDRLITLLNAYYYLTDQARFECMRRLGWINATPRGDRSIIEAVMDSATYDYAALLEAPEPTPAHPAYEEDLKSKGLDRPALVRRYAPQALAEFAKKVNRASTFAP